MLTSYISQTRRLLQHPSANSANLYSDADLTAWINIARGQLAGESECIRVIGTVSTVAAQQPYNFSSLNVGTPATTGIEAPINIRSINYTVASGFKRVQVRSWEWFDLFVLNNPVPVAGPPTVWSQYAQGAAPGQSGAHLGGSFYINLPDDVYVLNCDCVCSPLALADDTTPEAIPYLWTDAVPFFAAYFALLSAQNNSRMADAERYFNHYTTFVERARKASNPSVNRWLYQQAGDPAQAAKMQVQPGGANAGAGAG